MYKVRVPAPLLSKDPVNNATAGGNAGLGAPRLVLVKSAAPVVETVTAALLLVRLPYWSTACTRMVVTAPVKTNASSALTRNEWAGPAKKLTERSTSRSGSACDPGRLEAALRRQDPVTVRWTVAVTAPKESVWTRRFDVPRPAAAVGVEAVKTAPQPAVKVSH